MDKSEIEACVRRFFDTRLTNDAPAIFALMAPNAAVTLSGDCSASTFAVSCSDDAEIRSLVERMAADWRFMQVEIKKLVIDGSTAAAYVALEIVHTPSGASLKTDALDLITFENGLITEFVEFADTAMINQLQDAARNRA